MKSVKSLWVHHFQLKKRGKLEFKKMTPLLQIRQFSNYQLLPNITKFKKYKYQNLFSIYSNNISNCRRSKTTNKVRQCIKIIIDQQKCTNKLFDIYLNQIVLFLPNSEIEKHLRKALIPNPKETSTTTSHSKIVKNYQNYSKSYQKLIQSTSSQKWLNMIEYQSSNTNIIFNNYYILEFHQEQKIKIMKDFCTLKLALAKFNLFKFFVNYQSSNAVRGYKLCQRFLKCIQFESEVTEKYLLLVVRWRNYQKIMYTINNMVLIYEEQYRQKIEAKQQQKLK